MNNLILATSKLSVYLTFCYILCKFKSQPIISRITRLIPLDLKGVCEACSRYLSTNVYCASQLNDDICDTRLEALEMGVTIET